MLYVCVRRQCLLLLLACSQSELELGQRKLDCYLSIPTDCGGGGRREEEEGDTRAKLFRRTIATMLMM